MLNLIKMDFYRLFKSKSFYLIAGVSVIMSIFMMLMFGIYSLALDNLNTGELNAETMALLEATLPSTFSQYFEIFFFGNYVTLYLVIFIVIFCNAEFGRGYIKNIASLITPRYKMAFSKLIIIVFMTVVIYALSALIVVCGCAIGKVPMTVDNPGGLIKMIVVGILMNISISAFVMMLFYVFRKSMPALISGIVYVTMGSILYTFLNLLLKAVFQSEKIDCTKFTNLGNMLTHINASGDTETYVRASIVAVVILAISMAITCLSLNKKDIK